MKKLLIFTSIIFFTACSQQKVEYLLNVQPDDVVKKIQQDYSAIQGEHYCGNLKGYNNLELYYSTGEDLIKLQEGKDYRWCDDIELGGISFVINAPKNVIYFEVCGDFTIDIPKNETGAVAIYHWENGNFNFGQYEQYKDDITTVYLYLAATYNVPHMRTLLFDDITYDLGH